MFHIITLIPTGTSVGLTSAGLGVIRAVERKDVCLSVFKPIAQPCTGGDAPDQTTTIARANSSATTVVEPLKMSYIEGLLSNNQKDVLMEEIVANYHANTKDAEVALAEGLAPTRKHQFAQSLSYGITKMLNAEITLAMSQGTDILKQLKERIELTRNSFGGAKNTNIIGIIVNRLNAPVDEQGRTRSGLSGIFNDPSKVKVNNVDPAELQEPGLLPVLGIAPWSFDLIATHAVDMARHLNVTIINEGDTNTRRVKSVTFCARSISYMLEYFRAGSLLVTSTDRSDVLMAAYLIAMNNVEIGALLLTGDYEMDAHASRLCERAFTAGLPVFMAGTNTWQISLSLQSFNLEVPVDDHERIEKVQEYVANYINADWIESLTAISECSRRLSSSAFRYRLTELARKTGKCIALPEGDEPRTVKAAAICAERGIVTCILLGNPAEINRVTAPWGAELGVGIEIVDPEVVRESYADRLAELRKNKGMTEIVAREQLEDNVVLGTLILEQDEVDGLVSGAVHTVANTICPSLQLIKTAPGSSLVSPVFFVLLPEQVYVYGDRVINPDPTAEQLAETAIQSTDSAAAFGIEPCVVILSYFTGTSGAGSDVERVREATRLTQGKRPDLVIDDPLQYGAVVMADVAKPRASSFPVAGRATVLIFPDLNAGGTTYKTVQRSADLVSIGSMLQDMRKPVNDLSRGTLIDDTIYATALVAIQPVQQQ